MSMVNLENDHDLKTYLSPQVHKLLCKNDAVERMYDFYGSFKGGFFRWSDFPPALSAAPLNDSTEYVKWLESMNSLFTNVDNFFQNLSVSDFIVHFASFSEWTGQEATVLRCYSIITEKSSTAVNQTLLLLTSTLERALGDLVLTRTKQCPSLLKDLLVMPELEDLLSPVVAKFLKLLVGPPVSLNLRNIVWHGFPRPGELDRQYSYSVICAILSIGQIIDAKGPVEIIHREMVQLSCPEVFPLLRQSDVQEIEALCYESAFVVPCMRPFWKLSLNLFAEGRYGECLVVLLPQFELAMRRVFVAVNCCSTRLLTAENSTLFTTFDEILDQFLEDGSENRLRYVAGDPHMSLVMDFFVYPLGPRIRDRISHGEVNLCKLPASVASHVICLCAVFALKFHRTAVTDTHTSDFLHALQRTAENYVSRFHTLSFAKQQVCFSAECLSKWNSFPQPDADDLEQFKLDGNAVSVDVTTLAMHIINGLTSMLLPEGEPSWSVPSVLASAHFQSWVSTEIDGHGTAVSTVYRYSFREGFREEELLRLIIRITKLIALVTEQLSNVTAIKQTQWQRKEMRSRQRKNYGRLLNSINVMSVTMKATVIAMLLTVCHADDFRANTTVQSKLGKFFKACQKYVENVISYTKADSNRWDEAVSASQELLSQMLFVP